MGPSFPIRRVFAGLWLVALLALAGGVGLLALSAWGRPLAQAEQAATDGNLELALERYAAGEARFNRIPFAKQFLPRAYEDSIANQLWLQYRLKRYEALIEKADTSPFLAAAHFWSGCASFEKFRIEKDPEARLGWLSRATDEFRKALEVSPTDWDSKYNYELSQRVTNLLHKEPKTPPTEMLQLLRQQPRQTGLAQKRTG